MARKFAEVWHERRWLAVAGDLTRPLLGGEDGEEQAHEVREGRDPFPLLSSSFVYSIAMDGVRRFLKSNGDP